MPNKQKIHIFFINNDETLEEKFQKKFINHNNEGQKHRVSSSATQLIKHVRLWIQLMKTKYDSEIKKIFYIKKIK